ncbi:protein of unknown function [Flavobacterium fontis]|uniref:DUF4407 domain-containing protein n=1 Tax=Flavobacterium fontis TaxID=1124188 RepID=A0A1M5CDU2_9FLAO|nr:protein of unknown function [Flavobacterium fontis]
MCLGGIVFATGAMAGLAGGYAFYTIFENRGSAIDNPVDINTVFFALIFGVIWGLMIFNIDRFIVTSTGKGDGTEAITSGELKSALPRIMMGMIIALTISKPVEIRMFKTEIDIKLHEKQIEQKQIYINKIDSTYRNEINLKKNEIKKFETRIIQLQKISDTLKTRIDFQTANGGCKDKCEEYKSQLKNNNIEISRLEDNVDYKRVNSEILVLEKEREKRIKEGEKVANGLDGLLERIKIAHEVAGFWISLFITLLFMAIELTPIFFKLMLTKTTYDYLAENRDELLKAEYGIEVQYDKYKDKEGVERHLTINHEAERIIFEKKMVTNIQKELTKYAVTKYKEREMKKIDDNLDDYIKGINE